MELAVSAVVISTLAGVLLVAMLDYQALAERTMVDLTLRNMRTGMRYRVAELLFAQRAREISALVGSNPVAFLARPPANYRGEVAGPLDVGSLPPGSWTFDSRARELVYRVNLDGGFTALDGGGKVVRIKVLAAPERGADGSLLGVSIRIANRYDWR
jgi:general secretion pathway protein G